ncbi:MAG: hypothetical protein MMC23_001187 [Stictis urceolatum]|nr:hypothetical protein [Stictis urceolata]
MATHALLQNEHHDAYDFISPYSGLKDAAKGATILITGAGTGVGRATAHTFAAAGATHLLLAARRPDPLSSTRTSILSSYPNCTVTLFANTDISSPASVRALFSSIPPGTIPDLLVNNVGRGGKMIRVDEGEDEEEERWWADFKVNTWGTYLMTRGYLKLLEASGREKDAEGRKGRVVCLSSAAGWKEIPGLSGYAGSKSAVNRLVEYVDHENKEKGIRCFGLQPGGVAGTDLTKAMGMPEWLEKMLTEKPELAAATVLYLFTSRADYLGGRYVTATWDMENLEQMKEQIVKDDLLKTRILGVAL